MKQTYIGPQHSYERIEGGTRERFLGEVPEGASRDEISSAVSRLVGGEYEENRAYAEGFARAWFRETAQNMDNSYRVHQGIPGIEEPDSKLDKHIQAGWINGRNTRLAAEDSEMS